MILELLNRGKDIGSRHVERLGGELRSGVFSIGVHFFLILLVFAVGTDRTRAAGSERMTCARFIFGSEMGMCEALVYPWF